MKKDNKGIVLGIVALVVIILLLKSRTVPLTIFGVVGIDCPYWNTNTVNGNYGYSVIWVTTDCDGDGNYEAYGAYAISDYDRTGITGQTPEGLDYSCRFPPEVPEKRIYIWQESVGQSAWIMRENFGSASDADLSCGTPTGQNLIPDPSFTNGGIGWDKFDYTIIDTSIYHTSPASLRMDCTDCYSGPTDYITTLVPGETVTFSIWIRQDSNIYGGGGGVTFYDSSWTQIGEISINTADIYDTSLYFSESAEVPVGTAFTTSWVGAWGGPGSIWFDDVSLTVAGAEPSCGNDIVEIGEDCDPPGVMLSSCTAYGAFYLQDKCDLECHYADDICEATYTGCTSDPECDEQTPGTGDCNMQCQYTTICTESWQCTTWSACVGSVQTRTCTDSNSCGTTVNKPAESQSCTSGVFVCDANEDGLISRDELGIVGMKWITG